MIKNSEVAVGDSPQKDDYGNFAAELLTSRQFEPDDRPSDAERCIVEWLNGAIAPPGKSPVRMALLLIQLSPGDDINRGPDSCGAIETRWELPAQCGLVPILGRHPALMIESRDDCHAVQCWDCQGGEATVQSSGDNAGTGQIPRLI